MGHRQDTTSAGARSARWLAAVALGGLALFGAACSSGNAGSTSISHTPKRSEVVAALRRLNLPSATVTCVADHMFAKLSDEELRQLVDQAGESPDQVSPLLKQNLSDALAPCVPTPSTTTTPITG